MRFYNADIRLSAQSGRAEFRQLVHSRDTLRKIRAPVNRADFLQHVNDFFLFLVVACGCKHHRDIAAARAAVLVDAANGVWMAKIDQQIKFLIRPAFLLCRLNHKNLSDVRIRLGASQQHLPHRTGSYNSQFHKQPPAY